MLFSFWVQLSNFAMSNSSTLHNVLFFCENYRVFVHWYWQLPIEPVSPHVGENVLNTFFKFQSFVFVMWHKLPQTVDTQIGTQKCFSSIPWQSSMQIVLAIELKIMWRLQTGTSRHPRNKDLNQILVLIWRCVKVGDLKSFWCV